MDLIRRQYEDHPYPPIPWLALPRRSEGSSLQGVNALSPRRVLVVGCGTLEPIVVAQAHPQAEEIVALDLPEASLRVARKRARWARLTRRLAPITFERADFLDWAEAQRATGAPPFDLVLASNVLHHLESPAAALAACARLLVPGGFVRLTTYPSHSRHFMRETARYFAEQGLASDQPDLLAVCARLIKALPARDPRRSCFESHPERLHRASLIDAFFNARENPLRPLEWREAARAAGLTLKREDQDEGSRSDWLGDLAPATRSLDAWTRLEVLDLLLEVCANPVLWLEKVSDNLEGHSGTRGCRTPLFSLQEAVAEATRLLAPTGVSVATIIGAIARESGPRVSAPPESRDLPGLSILDHPWHEWVSTES